MVRPGFEQPQGRERELNLIASAPLWVAILFGCAMAAAAIEDVARFRISNITSLIVLLGAIGAAIVVGPTWALWENGAVFLADAATMQACILALGVHAPLSAGYVAFMLASIAVILGPVPMGLGSFEAVSSRLARSFHHSTTSTHKAPSA